MATMPGTQQIAITKQPITNFSNLSLASSSVSTSGHLLSTRAALHPDISTSQIPWDMKKFHNIEFTVNKRILAASKNQRLGLDHA
jgi:hypothetical protein